MYFVGRRSFKDMVVQGEDLELGLGGAFDDENYDWNKMNEL